MAFELATEQTPMRVGDVFLAKIYYKPGFFSSYQEDEQKIVSQVVAMQKDPNSVWSKVHVTSITNRVQPAFDEEDKGPYIRIEGIVTKNPWPAILLYIAISALITFLVVNVKEVNIFVQKAIQAATKIVEGVGNVGSLLPILLIGGGILAYFYFRQKK